MSTHTTLLALLCGLMATGTASAAPASQAGCATYQPDASIIHTPSADVAASASHAPTGQQPVDVYLDIPLEQYTNAVPGNRQQSHQHGTGTRTETPPARAFIDAGSASINLSTGAVDFEGVPAQDPPPVIPCP